MSDWTQARVVGHNASDIWDWAVTSVCRVSVEGASQNVVTLPHSKAGHWPMKTIEGTTVEGNPWLVARVHGEWLTATWEWLRPGQTRKTMAPQDFQQTVKAPEFLGWDATGQTVGFFVSAIARRGFSTVRERSNVTWWDYATGQPVAGPPDEAPVPPEPPLPPDDLVAAVRDLEARVLRLEARFRQAGEVMGGL
jgi:hypothetical protein